MQGMGITLVQATTQCGYSEGIIEENNQEVVLDTEQVETFTDDFFKEYMETYHIPGGAVIIVQGDKVLFQKGYGYSDLEAKEQFTTEQTYFSIASITKVFTASAIMKLVQEGKVELEEDILTYLPTLKLDNPYKDHITVRQLLTHTGGIDSSYTEDLSYEQTNNEKPHNLLNLLNKRGIKVINRPGEFIEYSSYGTAVLGAIVEEVSGISCERYIRENLLEPLEMKHTAVLSADIKRTKGYLYGNNTLTEGQLKGYFRLYPEGGLVSSIEDMGHYLEMLLANGVYKENRILEASIIEEMLKEQASFHTYLAGMGYGFAEYENCGVRSMGHAGYAIDGTLSEIVLYPEQGIGTFIVVNQGSNNNIQEDFREAFIKQFLAEDNIGKRQVSEIAEEMIVAKEVEGVYRFSDYPRTNLYKANTFGMGEVKITAVNSTTILISGMDGFTFEPYEKKADLVEGLVYKVQDEESYMVFKQDDQGKVAYMAESSSSSHGIYERIKWYDESKWQMPFFIMSLIIYSLQLIISLVCFVRRKLKKENQIRKDSQRISWVINGIAFLNIGFFAYSMSFWGYRLHYTVPLDIYVNLTMPILSLVLTVILGLSVIYKMYHINRLGRREYYELAYEIGMLILSIVFILFLNYWNFLGYKL